ncbi:MAG TPA: TRAP transporter small permease, partial [Methylomirabilota bacterium]|nr:TRAP transporter small permease [Methylomirabilota bacterium]
MIGRVARSASTLAGLAVLAIVALITYDVAMRYFFNEPQLFVDELASFLEALVIFGGLAYTFRTGGHVRVDLVTTHLPGRVRAWL